MESNNELENARNEVLRKIGRNMLLFQQVEHLLKHINSSSTFSGYVNEIKANNAKRSEVIHKQTMGQLVGDFIEDIYSDKESNTELTDITEAHLTFKFSISTDDACHIENKKQTLESIVLERNELIHHLLPRLNPDSISSWCEIEQYLDKQRGKILPEIQELKNISNLIKDGREELSVFLKSEDGKKYFNQLFLHQSPLVKLLNDIADQMARSDGWTYLSIAGQLCRKHATEEIVTLNQKYGYKKLTEFILATDLFDFLEEITDKGGVRMLYKPKYEDIKFQS